MSDESTAGPLDLVPFRIARTPFEARVIAAVLEAAGIPASTPDGLLADEFATSQRLMNLQNVRVLVPRARLADAEAALLEARTVGEGLDDAFEPVADSEGKPESLAPRAPGAPAKPRFGLTLALAAASVVFFIAWLEARADRESLSGATALWSVDRNGPALEYRRGDGTLALRSTDRDANGVVERHEQFDRSGRLVSRALDEDQDGEFETIESFDREGRLTWRARDADGDGRLEAIHQPAEGGVETVFLDPDGAGRYPVLELREADGRLRVRQELDVQRGFVTR